MFEATLKGSIIAVAAIVAAASCSAPSNSTDGISPTPVADDSCATTVSPKSGDPAMIRVVNTSNATLTVSWLDFEGTPVNSRLIVPNDVWQVSSYAGHAFRLEAKGRATLTACADPLVATFVVDSDGRLFGRDEPAAAMALSARRDRLYSKQSVNGHSVWVRKSVFEEPGRERDVELIASRVRQADALLAAHSSTVASVDFWIELSVPHAGGAGRFHPSDLPPALNAVSKRDSIEIVDLATFATTLRRSQPNAIVHELAHVLYSRSAALAGPVEAAFATAVASKSYESVSQGRQQNVRAYALTNSHEYFAELTEAYLGTNDFYPYTREQLAEHDEAGTALMANVYGASDYRVSATSSACAARVTSSDGAASSILFKNRRPEPVEIFWINSGGGAIANGQVAAGGHNLVLTRAGHVFESRVGGACVGRHTAALRPSEAAVQ